MRTQDETYTVADILGCLAADLQDTASRVADLPAPLQGAAAMVELTTITTSSDPLSEHVAQLLRVVAIGAVDPHGTWGEIYAYQVKRSTRVNRTNVDVPGNARAALAKAKVHAVELSREYGGSVAYWSRRLNGETPISVDDLFVIAEAAGVSPALLLTTDLLPPSHQSPH